MNRSTFILLASIPIFACVPACTDNTEGENADLGSADGTQTAISVRELVGTYNADSTTLGQLTQLVLKTDFSYHAARVVACIKAPCPPVELDGTFRLERRREGQFMSLFDGSGRLEGYYFYKAIGDGIEIHPWRYERSEPTAIPDSAWQILHRADVAWCAVPADCSMQGLSTDPCAHQWLCGKNACSYVCTPGPGPVAPAKPMLPETPDRPQ